jgi:hypothetical protein
MIATILKYISPAQLKKYGMYAMLSFFMAISVYLVMDDRKERREQLRYEREEKEKLQNILLEQTYLRLEQEQLMEMAKSNLKMSDTVKNLSIDVKNKYKTLKSRRNGK